MSPLTGGRRAGAHEGPQGGVGREVVGAEVCLEAGVDVHSAVDEVALGALEETHDREIYDTTFNLEQHFKTYCLNINVNTYGKKYTYSIDR